MSWPRNQSQTSIETCCLLLTRERLIYLKTRDLSRRLPASSVAQHVVAATASTMPRARTTMSPTPWLAWLLHWIRARTDGSMNWVGGPEPGLWPVLLFSYST